MQHALKHVERPGGSHTALDGKKNYTVIFFSSSVADVALKARHYTVSFEYPGPSPSLKGAGDNDLPVKGVVDLEFKVGKDEDYHEACSSGRNSFECDLNLHPFGNWLEDSPWQC